MRRPLVGITAWHRRVATQVGPMEPMFTLDVGYARAIDTAGGLPVILPTLHPDRAVETLSRLDGLLLAGGGDIDPDVYGADNTRSTDLDGARDEWELALARTAAARDLPMLGICRGLQLINVAFGGTLHQHVWQDETDHPDLLPPGHAFLEVGWHEVRFEPDARLRAIYGCDRRTVNGLHHQGIDRLADGLAVAARTGDGAVEAIEATSGRPVLAVQWHPERLPEADERPLFEAFVRSIGGRGAPISRRRRPRTGAPRRWRPR